MSTSIAYTGMAIAAFKVPSGRGIERNQHTLRRKSTTLSDA
jgi:hypothetical protein